jgi:hypothetical protein
MKSINSTRVGGLVSLPGVLTPNAPIDESFIPAVLYSARTGMFSLASISSLKYY